MSEEKKQVTITIKSSGSISIEGDVVLQDRDGNLIPRPPEKHPGILKLCACGHSKIKPFCDGTHNELKAGKRGSGEATPLPEPPLPQP
jgi:CDGSH-type Zn-finger protein